MLDFHLIAYLNCHLVGEGSTPHLVFICWISKLYMPNCFLKSSLFVSFHSVKQWYTITLHISTQYILKDRVYTCIK